MPTKHVIKHYSAPAYYHVYNRASGERLLFRDTKDRTVFLILLQKHLRECLELDDYEVRTYEVEIIAYCLMGTHFHLLLFQETDMDAISGYMRSVSTSYSMYYNKKYKSKGHVFQSSFRASYISNEAYLAHITRYIHLNPRRYETWQWSSYRDYVGETNTAWVHPERMLENRQLGQNYAKFVSDYAPKDRRNQHTELQDQLAE